MFTEAELAELLAFMRGEGAYRWLYSHTLRTYPDGDANDQRLYAACRALECRGLIRRVAQEITPATAIVFFTPIPDTRL